MKQLLLAGLLLPSTLVSQSSPYVPLDDPRLPVFEHLVVRGEVRDPSPMVRPFRRADALRVLLEADSAGVPSRRRIQELRAAWVQDTAIAQWGLEARAGLDATSLDNRDLLHPQGEGVVVPYGEFTGNLAVGSFIGVARPAIEPRLTEDPDWPGRHDLVFVGRMAEAYLSGQWKYGNVFFGTIDRQWGPAGIAGIPLSAYAYPRTEFAFELGTEKVRLTAHSAQLTDQYDTLGARIHSYWFAHRLTMAPSRRFAAALWETTVLGGQDREFDSRWRNPVSALLLANQYGLGADGNLMVGADLTWWASPGLRLEGQIAVDDLNYPDGDTDDQTPSRYAFTLAASGPLGRAASWKGLYTQASSLAFRTASPWETYADAGVGLGRGYAGMDQASLFVSIPVRAATLITPELAMQRQGEGRLTDPFPTAAAAAGDVPALFIGTVETTWRAAVGFAGAYGDLRAAGNLGVHYVQDADHVAGASRTDIVARLRITIGIATGGHLQ